MNLPQSQAALPVYRFNSALVRAPGRSVVRGLRASERGDPTYEGVQAEHEAYVVALRAAGVAVAVLPPLEAFPDAVFVEDPALVVDAGAVLLRPGAPSRSGEAAALEAQLRSRFATLLRLAEPGHAEGGDVLVLTDRVLIGRSARTDEPGARALRDCLRTLGRRAEIVTTPAEVLHLKSACALLDEETVLLTAPLAQSGIFSRLRQLMVAEGEAAAANVLRVNDVVLASSAYPRTLERLDRAGFQVVPLPTREIGLLDAGLSCMSLRWLDSGPGPERGIISG